jgi:hypothetical protein
MNFMKTNYLKNITYLIAELTKFPYQSKPFLAIAAATINANLIHPLFSDLLILSTLYKICTS